jgi:GST-like protein
LRGLPQALLDLGPDPPEEPPAMLDLYVWPTPNAYKVSILLEELGLAYNVHPVDIGKGDQFKPEFLKISPNNKMPALVDGDGPGGAPYAVFESGAILMYLCERNGAAGARFFPTDMRKRYDVIQWLMFQMGGIGPMLGQAHHFRQYAPEPVPYAIDRYTKEAGRLYGVLDRRLAEVPYLAGEYSIADMAVFPWTRTWERQGQNIDDFPNVKRWFAAIDARPAVAKGLKLLEERRRTGPMDAKQKEVLFGATQYAKR